MRQECRAFHTITFIMCSPCGCFVVYMLLLPFASPSLQANRIINHLNAILHFDLYTHILCLLTFFIIISFFFHHLLIVFFLIIFSEFPAIFSCCYNIDKWKGNEVTKMHSSCECKEICVELNFAVIYASDSTLYIMVTKCYKLNYVVWNLCCVLRITLSSFWFLCIFISLIFYILTITYNKPIKINWCLPSPHGSLCP